MIDIKSKLDALAAADMLRHIPADSSGEGVTDFSTNDYLGLATEPGLAADFLACRDASAPPMFSASASRLLASAQSEFTALEECLRSLYGRDALLFNSGYHANTGLVGALTSLFEQPLVVADKLVHASIIDGIILSRTEFRRFPHNDFYRLEAVMERAVTGSRRPDGIIVIVESVYSMDGDRADIDRLIDIKRRFSRRGIDVMLYVDEAHAVGVEGPAGLGLSAASTAPSEVDVVVGTFGKALASAGAFAVTGADLRQWIVNRARSFIFSTALPPVVAAWSRHMLGIAAGADSRRAALRRLASLLDPSGQRYIYPAIVGSAAAAVDLSRRLMAEEHIKVLPIRTPTVAPGTERLRISLRATDTPADVLRLRQFIDNALSQSQCS